MASATKAQGKKSRYEIQGEMTIYRAAELKKSLIDHILSHKEIEIDLSQVSEVDSAGLQLLILAKLEASARNKMLRFENHSPAVMEILDLSDLTGFFGDPVVITSHADK